MRSVVSLIETRPETVGEDYRRVLELAGIPTTFPSGPPVLLAAAGEAGFRPGFSSPPWQLSGVLDFFEKSATGEGPVRLFPVGGTGPARSGSPGKEAGWTGVLDKRPGCLVPAPERELKPVRVGVPLPALGAVLKDGFRAPPILAGVPVVLLPTPVLNRSWQLAGGTALLAGLLAGRTRPDKRIPRSEVIAEVMGLARETTAGMISVLDGVIWGVYRQDGKAHPLVRNVLLAGNDPVAVDAVAARLAGLDPRRIPWLQLCAERRLGHVDPDRIDLRGQKELLDLDFQFPEGTFGSDSGRGAIFSWPGRVLGSLGRGKPGQDFAASAWGRLLADYRTGDVE